MKFGGYFFLGLVFGPLLAVLREPYRVPDIKVKSPVFKASILLAIVPLQLLVLFFNCFRTTVNGTQRLFLTWCFSIALSDAPFPNTLCFEISKLVHLIGSDSLFNKNFDHSNILFQFECIKCIKN